MHCYEAGGKSMNLNIQHEKKDDKDYLAIAGEIDAYTAPKLREMMLPLTENEGALIVVNLSDVQYMDSTGLGIFIAALKSSQQYESGLKLQGMTPRVKRLFDITGLKEVMNIDGEIKGGTTT
jgi:anti-sigma B factor antagonist